MYRPDLGDLANHRIDDPREAFQLHDDIGIYAGFVGTESSTEFNLRAPYVNLTILIGDIGTANDISDNSFHVVTGYQNFATAIIDGFIIRDGNAFDAPQAVPNPPVSCLLSQAGGGMALVGFDHDNSPAVLRCTFVNNQARFGGAVFTYGHSDSAPIFENCKFISNQAGIDEQIQESGSGGAVYIQDDYCEVGPSTKMQQPHFTNCLFDSNMAENSGGAAYSEFYAHFILTNCTIVRNSALVGPGGLFHNNTQTCPSGNVGSMTLDNCILWDNHCSDIACTSTTEILQLLGTHTLNYCCVQNLNTAPSCVTNSFDSDPQFADPSNGNFRLKRVSPCINRGNPTTFNVVPYDIYDLNQDTNINDLVPDLDLRERVACSIIDVGCYERDQLSCAGDVTGNGVVDVDDLLAVINAWGACPSFPNACPADIAPSVVTERNLMCPNPANQARFGSP